MSLFCFSLFTGDCLVYRLGALADSVIDCFLARIIIIFVRAIFCQGNVLFFLVKRIQLLNNFLKCFGTRETDKFYMVAVLFYLAMECLLISVVFQT